MKFTIEKVVHYKIFASEPENKLTITLTQLPQLSKGFTFSLLEFPSQTNSKIFHNYAQFFL